MKLLHFSSEDYVPHGSVVVNIKGPFVDKEALFSFLADELKFPDYFGKNWDALYDCLVDLNPERQRKVILLHMNPLGLNNQDTETYFTLLFDVIEFSRVNKGVVVDLIVSAENLIFVKGNN